MSRARNRRDFPAGTYTPAAQEVRMHSPKPLIVFSHGQAATPWGRKISYMAPIAEEAGWRVMSIDYTDLESPDDRVQRLKSTDLGQYGKLVLAGSSMGGYVSTVASDALKPDGLFLLAPAFYMDWYGVQKPHAHAGRTLVISGWNDDVVPVDSSIRFARETKAELHIFNSDHVLWDVLPVIGSMLTAFLNAVASK